MPRLANISGTSAVKAFIRSGYTHSHTSGDHAILQKTGSPTLSIPLHKEVAPFLLKSQIKRANISQDEFLKFLKKKK
jgi:predicted RNA binding protein YcfA (HicA-like mRNA interferase family)